MEQETQIETKMFSDYLKDKYRLWEQISAEEFHAAQASIPPNEFWGAYQQSSHFGRPVFYQKRNKPDDAELLALIADRIQEDSQANADHIHKELKRIKVWVVILGALSIALCTMFLILFISEYLYWL